MAMRRLIFLLSAMLATLAPLSASADRVQTVRPGPDAAQIVGSPGFPTRDIFAVTFVEINGQNISPRDVMWLEPGTYRITVQIQAALTRPPQYRRPADAPDYNVIELEIEAGKSYHIRGRYNRNDRETPYSVILHQIEE